MSCAFSFCVDVWQQINDVNKQKSWKKMLRKIDRHEIQMNKETEIKGIWKFDELNNATVLYSELSACIVNSNWSRVERRVKGMSPVRQINVMLYSWLLLLKDNFFMCASFRLS